MLGKEKFLKKTVAAVILILLILAEFLPITSNIVWAAEKTDNAISVKGYFSTDSAENVDSLVCNTRRK